MVVAAAAAAATPARAEPGGAGVTVGLGVGPAPALGGDLAAHAIGSGASIRFRLGMRARRVGIELATAGAAIESPAGAGAPTTGFATLSSLSLAWYAVARPPLQLAARAGLGFGVLSFDERMATCEAPCNPDLAGDAPGYGVTAGLTAQLHLAPRRRTGGRPVLWADLGGDLLRHRVDGAVVAGRSVQLTLGLAYGYDE